MANRESRSIALEHPEQLVAIGSRIRDNFSALTAYTEAAVPVSSLENESQRFGLWANNLGLYTTGHSSLEYRLGDAPSAYQYTKKALRDLEKYLGILLQALKEGQGKAFDTDVSDNDEYTDSDSEDFDTYDREPFVETALSNASRTIDRLYRLAFKIRNPATRTGFTKARNYQQIDAETGVDLIQAFALFDSKHVQEIFLQNNPEVNQEFADNFLVKRLAKSITQRRQQFKQWTSHRIKVDINTKDAGRLEVFRPSNAARTTPVQEEMLKVTPDYDVAAFSAPSSATRIDDAHVNLDDTTSITSSSTYVRLSQQPEYSVEIPELPKKLKGETEFECPYCHILCSRRTARAQAWKAHVLRDLRPYICTYEECRDGDQQYDTFKQWVAHEEYCHRTVRKCTEHGEETLYSESEWREHLNDHRGDTRIPQSFIIEQTTNDVAGTRQCPICPEGTATNEHVAIHLQQLALFALPRSTGLEDETGSINQDSAATNPESRQSQLDDLEKLSFSDTDPCNTKPQVYGNDYSKVGNYLGELDHHQLSADKWDEGESWYAKFNPNIPRSGDIELVWKAHHEGSVTCVAYSESGKYIAIGMRRVAIVYGSDNGEEISRLEHECNETIGYVGNLCFDLEERILISGADDKLVRLFDISKRILLRTYVGHEERIMAVTISPDGTRIISSSVDATVRVWRIADGELLLTLGCAKSAASVDMSPDGQYLAAGLSDGTVAVFSIKGSLIKTLGGVDKHTDVICSAHFTLDSQSLITASYDETIKLWKFSTGEVSKTFSGHQASVLSAKPFQTDSIILSGDDEGNVMAWNTQTGQALFLLVGHDTSVFGLDRHPTMDLFATASVDGTVKVWRYKNRT